MKMIVIFNEAFNEIKKDNIFAILDKFIFEDEHKGYHHGQHDYLIRMFDKSKNLLAYASYSEFQGEITINIINSKVSGRGYGKILMIFLAKKYGYENLERKSLTDSGFKMRQELDKLFNFNYKEHLESKSKHFPKSIMFEISKKHPEVAEILSNLYFDGHQEAWKKLSTKKDIPAYFEYDFDDIANIAEWIKGSKLNKNPRFEDPPEYVIELVDSLI